MPIPTYVTMPPMHLHALLLDLDDTLIPDESASEAAFLAACAPVAERYGLDPATVARSAGACARQIWHTSDHIAYCQSIGISSWEGLWADFTGDTPDLQRLHAWAPAYRREAWTRALAQHGVDDPAFAEHLADRFRHERRQRNAMFPDAAELLPQFARHLPLTLVTNGAPDLQHFKIDASGVRPYFQSIVVSGEVGIGKPHPAPMQRALQQLNCDPAHAAMVGNNLTSDIAGALNTGVHAIWLNRDSAAVSGGIYPDHTISSLRELADLVL